MVKIVSTIGPTSMRKNILHQMFDSEVDIVRINTKYGDLVQWEKMIKNTLSYKTKKKILFDIKNLEFIDWIKKQKFDYIAISFTESAEQIKKIRKQFLPKKIKVISKIESKKGLKHLESIINESDGIMIARGDLAKNISFEKVPIKQKFIIKKCNESNKFVITATEMLLSMVNSEFPGKAEVSDIVNTVLDGSNALMLSEETAIGNHPILVVKTMKKIIDEAKRNKKLLIKD